MIAALARSAAGRLLLAAYAVTAIVCAFLPLADHIGFELAVVLTVVAACFAPAVGFTAIRLESRVSPETQRPARAAASAGLFAVLALLIPTAIILLNAVRRPICDPVAGSVWLLLLSAPTAWLSATLGAMVRALFRRTGAAVAAVVAIELGSVITAFISGYLGPVAYGYDHFAGYYNGTFRSSIPVTAALLSFRAATVAWGAAIVTSIGAIWTVDAAARRMHRSWAIGLTALLLTITIGWGDGLGWRTSDRSLRRAIAGEQTVDGVVVHYSRRASDRYVDGLMRDVAYTAQQVRSALQLTPVHPVHVWVYNDPVEKDKLVGVGHVNFAKPYRHEIHVIASQYPQESLRHELIHAYAAEFAPLPWGAAGGVIPNVALIEGLAEAYDIEDGTLSLFQDAKAMRALGIAPDLEQMMSVSGFGNQATSRAYAYSGAFIRYLGDRFGLAAVKNLYRTNDFASLGDTKSIIGDFEQMLDTVQSNANARSAAARRHSTPAVTRRTCAREVYALTDSAYALAANRLWNASLQMFDRACALQPENPDLLNEKLSVAIRMRPATMAPILEVANALFGHPQTDPTLEAQTHLQLGDTYLRRDDLGAARIAFKAAVALPSGPDVRRAIAVRLLAMDDSVRLEAVRYYFDLTTESPLTNKYRLIDLAQAHPGEPVVLYLLGREYYLDRAYEHAARTFERADRARLPDPDIARENLRLLVIAASNLNRCDEAQKAVDRLRTLEGSRVDLATSADWVSRCRFAAARGWKPL